MKVIPANSTLTGSFEFSARSKGKLPPQSQQDAIHEEALEDFRQDDNEDDRYLEEDDRRFQLSNIIRKNGHFRDQREGHNYMPKRRYTDLDVPGDSSEDNLEHFYQRRTPSKPVSAKTFPSGRGKMRQEPNGRRAYPKEKWVAPPPSLLRVESKQDAGLDSSDSADDFLKSCAKNGKYQVDQSSFLDSKLRSQEEEPRYNEARYDIPIRKNSSDDDVAMWRSYDDESEDSEDWDTSMPMPTRRSKSKVAVVQMSYDDDETLESFEMMSFDPKNVQALTSSNRLNQNKEVASFPNRLVDKPSKKLAKKMKKRQQRKERRDTLAEIKRSRSRSKDRSTKEELSLSELRTMSAISNSNSWEDSRDGASYSSSSSLDTQERKAFRKQHREEHRRWLKHRQEGRPYPKLSPSQDCPTEDLYDLSDASSGSVDSEEQRRFRKQKKAEHRRWLAEKKRRETGASGDESGNESPSDNEGRTPVPMQALPRSNSKSSRSDGKIRVVRKAPPAKGLRGIIGGLFQRKKPHPRRKDRTVDEHIALYYDANVYSNDESEQGPPDGALPWENQKKQLGLVQQVVSNFRPGAKKPIQTVEDLPFPKSDSFDTSLIDRHDKYDDLINDLPALVVESYDNGLPALDVASNDNGLPALVVGSNDNDLPALVVGSDYEIEASPLNAAASVASNEFSTDSSAAKKEPLRRAKKGLGNTFKKLLKNPF